MANTPQGVSTVQTGSRKPVDVLPDQLSLFVTNLQPILILSLLAVSFKSLVRDPTPTLMGLAPVLAGIQLVYCVCSLPTSAQAIKPGQKRKTIKQTPDLSFRIVVCTTQLVSVSRLTLSVQPAFLSLFLTLSLSAPLLFIAVILFGGPLVSNTRETLLLALHFALLASPQLFYTHGLDKQTWLKIASLQLPVDELYGMSLGACLGAWMGAIPIPLDWDREWQRWPVTIVAGVYLGAVLGKLLGGHVFKGLQMKIT